MSIGALKAHAFGGGQTVASVVDMFIVVVSYSFGLGLLFLGTSVINPSELWVDLLIALPLIAGIHLLANVLAGAYGHVWGHASTNEAMRVVVANACALLSIAGLNLLLRQTGVGVDGDLVIIPWSVIAVGGLLSMLLMGIVRFR